MKYGFIQNNSKTKWTIFIYDKVKIKRRLYYFNKIVGIIDKHGKCTEDLNGYAARFPILYHSIPKAIWNLKEYNNLEELTTEHLIELL